VGGFSAPIFGKGGLVGNAEGARKLRLLWVSCGDKDTLFDGNKNFHTALEAKKVPHVWHIDKGGHTFSVWKNDLYLLAPLLFRGQQREEKKQEEKKAGDKYLWRPRALLPPSRARSAGEGNRAARLARRSRCRLPTPAVDELEGDAATPRAL